MHAWLTRSKERQHQHFKPPNYWKREIHPFCHYWKERTYLFKLLIQELKQCQHINHEKPSTRGITKFSNYSVNNNINPRKELTNAREKCNTRAAIQWGHTRKKAPSIHPGSNTAKFRQLLHSQRAPIQRSLRISSDSNTHEHEASVTVTRQHQTDATKQYDENTASLRVYHDSNNQRHEGSLSDNERKLCDGWTEDHTATLGNATPCTFLVTATEDLLYHRFTSFTFNEITFHVILLWHFYFKHLTFFYIHLLHLITLTTIIYPSFF